MVTPARSGVFVEARRISCFLHIDDLLFAYRKYAYSPSVMPKPKITNTSCTSEISRAHSVQSRVGYLTYGACLTSTHPSPRFPGI